VWAHIKKSQVLLESDVIELHDQKKCLLRGVDELAEIWGVAREEVVAVVNVNWERCRE